MKIAFIGGGNMAGALIGGLIKKGASPENIYVIDVNETARNQLISEFSIVAHDIIDSTVVAFDVIVLAVKPQMLKAIAEEISPHLRSQLLLSVAAGVRLRDLSRWLGGYTRVIRSMPNMPALVGMGMTALVAQCDADAYTRRMAEEIMSTVGECEWFEDESHLDAVTAISGSGPAYVFYFLEALQTASQHLGLSESQSVALSLATFRGATQLAYESSETLSSLRGRVTSRGGTTAAALESFDTHKVKEAIINGALSAAKRAKQLGDELGYL